MDNMREAIRTLLYERCLLDVPTYHICMWRLQIRSQVWSPTARVASPTRLILQRFQEQSLSAMSKTLSNGTLSLRFMQNAQRAKRQAEIDLEQAKSKDEAEWEVSQEIKDAWGLSSTAAELRYAIRVIMG